MSDQRTNSHRLALDGFRPHPRAQVTPMKVQGGYRPPTSQHGNPPTGGSGANKPEK